MVTTRSLCNIFYYRNICIIQDITLFNFLLKQEEDRPISRAICYKTLQENIKQGRNQSKFYIMPSIQKCLVIINL